MSNVYSCSTPRNRLYFQSSQLRRMLSTCESYHRFDISSPYRKYETSPGYLLACRPVSPTQARSSALFLKKKIELHFYPASNKEGRNVEWYMNFRIHILRIRNLWGSGEIKLPACLFEILGFHRWRLSEK